VTAALPGSVQGGVSGNSTYSVGSAPCIGSGSCTITTTPTGLGTGGTAVVSTGDDHAGIITLTAGTGAAATGVLYLAPYSTLIGCQASLSNGGTAHWDDLGTVRSTYGSFGGSQALEITWINNSVALNNGSTYLIPYVCNW